MKKFIPAFFLLVILIYFSVNLSFGQLGDYPPVSLKDSYDTPVNTSLIVTTGSVYDLLDNDDKGSPTALIASFGGGSLGGAVSDNAAGASVAMAGGTLTVHSDGSFSLTTPTITGIFTFQYRLTNTEGSSDALVTINVENICPSIYTLNDPTPDQNATYGTWTVQSGGLYKIRITAKGAKGGDGAGTGGSGAVMTGEFVVYSGQTLEIVAGGIGQDGTINGAGGGGSGVKIGSNILIVAGGGGGAGTGLSTNRNAVVGTSGNDGAPGSATNGGIGGAGGNGGEGITWSQPIGGGGGVLSSGTDGAGVNSGAGGGAGFNGLGGIGFGSLALTGGSGFGGGGGASDSGTASGGGGGGYSGGGAGGIAADGGGAGSYNTGTNQSNTSGGNAGGGEVIIECLGQVCPPGNIFYVNDDATGANDGTSWTDAFTDLQSALNSTCPGVDQIWVAEGTYKPTSGTDRNISFILNDGIAMYGGFPNSGNPGMGDRDWVTNVTTLSGDIGTTNDASDNSYQVVLSVNDGINTQLDGFTITGGNANGSAGLYVEGLLISPNYGAGMYSYGSSLTLKNLSFIGNSASLGGGLYLYQGSSTLTNVIFIGNSANDGGGMFSYAACTLTNCVFSGNSAITNGGGVMVQYSPTFTNCVFYNNTVSNYSGGAITNNGSSPTLVNCTFFGNSAAVYGGAMYNVNFSTVIDKNSIYYNNSAPTSPDIHNFTPSGTLYDSYTSTTCLYSTDPLFINSADPDGTDNIWMSADDGLALQNGSPAENTGTDAGAPLTDILGHSRLGVTDMGAYEIIVNAPPVANAVNYKHYYNSSNPSFTIATPGVLTNDTDPDGNSLTAALNTDVSVGTLNLNSNGSFTYSYTAGTPTFSDSFTYFANDGTVNSTSSAIVTIDILPAKFIGPGTSFLDPANWIGGIVPDETVDIIIAANQTMVVDDDYTCGTLKFENGASFNCTNGKKLTITGNVLDKNGDVAIEVSSSLVVSSSITINN